MTKDEALRKALEALIECDLAFEECKDYPLTHDAVLPAIHAIKEALAQPEQKRPQNCGTGYCSCIECVMEPEQEPVAYLDEGLGAFYFAKQYKKNVGFTPLYTTPPQREWVGLTDEEVIKQANKEQNPESFARGVLWAEAKLKEKNT